MKKTLAERVTEALQGPPKKTQRALAAACSINPVSVNNWISGRTKKIEGVNLLKAAAYLEVSPRWLAEGIGPKRSEEQDNSPITPLTRTDGEPEKPDFTAKQFTPSDWALLEDVKLVVLPEELAVIRKRAAHVRAAEQEAVQRVASGAKLTQVATESDTDSMAAHDKLNAAIRASRTGQGKPGKARK